MAEWEAEVKIRRNGRIYRWEKALGDSPGTALYAVTNDLEREFFDEEESKLTAPEPTAVECTCPYTPPETWLSAASCGYGSGYEPGSMQEHDPDCPVHGGRVEP